MTWAVVRLACAVAAVVVSASPPPAPAPSAVDAAWVEAFRRDGYNLIEGFASAGELAAMKARIAAIAHAEALEDKAVFVTDERQGDAQAKSRQFFESAERVRVFYEDDGESINKVGHALHAADDVFGWYARSVQVASVLRAVGHVRPVLPQSMYIFKQARAGGAVTSHQDATFLHTAPHQTVIGLWLAVDEATLENGCLWARNGSHAEPLRRTFVRATTNNKGSHDDDDDDDDDDGEVHMVFEAAAEGEYLDERLLEASRRVGANAAAARWEGKNMDEATVRAQGFTPLPVAAGTLVVLAGTLDHLSLPNDSTAHRHTFQLHAIDGPDAGVTWSPANWLQYAHGRPFPALAQSTAAAAAASSSSSSEL